MSILSKLTLTTTTPNAPLTALARKRIKLLEKLDLQIGAAQAEAKDEEFFEEIKRWVQNDETGDKDAVTFNRPIKKWWWKNQHGALMISLKDGNKIIPLDDTNSSAEVGDIEQLVTTLETLRSAVIAGELDAQLEKLIANRKPFGRNMKKPNAAMQSLAKITKAN